MSFLPKEWRDYPDLSTPLDRESIRDLETRVTEYTDEQLEPIEASLLSVESGQADLIASIDQPGGIAGISATTGGLKRITSYRDVVLDNLPLDGATDCTPLIQPVIDDAITAGWPGMNLHLPAGYDFLLASGGIVCPALFQLRLYAHGSRFLVNGDYRAVSFGATGDHDAGTDPRGTPTNITQVVNRGDTRIYVTSTAGFVVDGFTELRGPTGAFATGALSLGAGTPLTEYPRVYAIGVDGTFGPYVDLLEPIEELQYPLANGGTGQPASTLTPLTVTPNWYSDVDVKNLTPNTNTPFSDGIQVRGGLGAEIKARCENIDEVGVILWDCFDCHVDTEALDFSDFVGGVRSSYASKMEAGQDNSFKVIARRTRHAFTTGGVARNWTVAGTAYGTIRGPWDSHAGSCEGTFTTVIAVGCGGCVGARGRGTVVQCMRSINPSGISVYAWGRSPLRDNRGHSLKIFDAVVSNSKTAIIKLVGADDFLIDGFDFDGITALTGQSAIFVGSDTTGLPGDDPDIPGSDAISNRSTVRNGTISNIGAGTGLYFALGDGHRYDNVNVRTAALGVRVGTLCTNFGHGKLRCTSVTDQIHSDVAVSYVSPAELVGTGSPENVSYGPIGSTYTRIDGTGATVHYRKETAPTAKTGWVPRASRPADLGERRDYRRKSECYTCHSLDGLASRTQTTGIVVGAHARNMVAQTYTKMRFATGATLTALTDCRLGVHDSSGLVLAETANISGALTINTLSDNIALVVPIALTLGQDVYLTVGAVGTSLTVQSITEALTAIAALTPANGPTKDTRTATWAGGVMVALSTSLSANIPWIELIP